MIGITAHRTYTLEALPAKKDTLDFYENRARAGPTWKISFNFHWFTFTFELNYWKELE